MDFKKNRVTHAKQKVANAISMFTKASEEVEQANILLNDEKLTRINEKEELEERIRQINNEVDDVSNQIESNNVLKSKLSEFILK
ncbi:hypothetical protein EBB07_28195 [Paenibacillaceae bacterium]|nr:hypothetical protein EBB07_28195 [Paenibacillaceae bacterium]